MKRWPIYSQDEIQVVEGVIRSGKVNYWTGEQGRCFEKEYAEYLGVPYAVAVSNGTVALELCLHALGIGAGDEVIVPSRTFMASASCVVEVGAKPVVIDIDLFSQNLTVETIKPHITSKTKAIIAVHLAGWPCDMPAIMEFARANHLYVIEDCAQAHGAKLNGKPVGSFGHIAAFSFCQDKIITTLGEGGLVATADETLWKKVWAYKDHGKSYDMVHQPIHQPGFRWVHHGFGSNYRMTEVQAAVGRLQLKKLDEWIMLRRRNAKVLEESLKKYPALRLAYPQEHIHHAYYRYYCFVQPDALKSLWSRDRIMTEIHARGVMCFVGVCGEIYLENAFQENYLTPRERFSNAKKLSETSLAFLVDPCLNENDMHKIAETIGLVMLEVTR